MIVRGGADATYVATGHLVYAAGSVLYAIPFDVSTLTTTGSAVAIVNDVQRAIGDLSATANYGVSVDGTLAYLNASGSSGVRSSTLGVVDRGGTVRSLDVPPAAYRKSPCLARRPAGRG